MNQSAGWLSLRAGVTGCIICKVLAGILLFAPAKKSTPWATHPLVTVWVLGFALILVMSLVAVICGILGRKTKQGKAGMVLSIVAVLFGLAVPCLLPLNPNA